jgi:hypothetical protein
VAQPLHFLGQKELTLAANRSSAIGTFCMSLKVMHSQCGLQFFTISMFKPGCDQLKVLTGLGLSRRTGPHLSGNNLFGDSKIPDAAMMKIPSR